MRRLSGVAAAITMLVFLSGCGHTFTLRQSSSLSVMLARASLVVVGTIESHEFELWPLFRVSLPPDARERKYWRVLRRRVRVESVLYGAETRPFIDVYEVFWTGGTSGDWNSTQDGERDVFPLCVEQGCYRVVQDWWRSIFPVTSGPHNRMPLDNTRSLWERIALMNWWIQRSDTRMRITYPYFLYNDPANALSQWRTVKLLRGLVRHRGSGVRVPACRELLSLGSWGQDECWEMLSEQDRAHLQDGGYFCCSASEVNEWRAKNRQRSAAWWWRGYPDRENRRLLTAINDQRLRAEFCRLYEAEYPGDQDTGCPANLPPPATVVTEDGDVPLTGGWPR